MESDIWLLILIIGLLVISLLMASQQWFRAGKCKSQATIEGKIVIVTGCNTGIGKETVRELAKRGAHVIMACRDLKKAQQAAAEIRMESKGKLTVYELDLASFQSIHAFAEKMINSEFKVDILINNAGVMMCPFKETEDGFEMHFGTNHLGHFLLTILLLDRIKQSAPSRIINISSIAHTKGKMNWDDLNFKKQYNPLHAYCQSKLANILFTKALAKKLEGTGVTCYAVHPGVVHTELGRHMDKTTNKLIGWLFENVGRICFKTSVQGAQTSLHCAIAEEVANESGFYYSDCAKKTPTAEATDEAAVQKLWDISMSMIGSKDFKKKIV